MRKVGLWMMFYPVALTMLVLSVVAMALVWQGRPFLALPVTVAWASGLTGGVLVLVDEYRTPPGSAAKVAETPQPDGGATTWPNTVAEPSITSPSTTSAADSSPSPP